MSSNHMYDFPFGDQYGFPRAMPQWLVRASVTGDGYDLKGWLADCGLPPHMIELAMEYGTQWIEGGADSPPFVLGRAGRAPQRPGTARLNRALSVAESTLKDFPRTRWAGNTTAIALSVLNALSAQGGVSEVDFDVGEPCVEGVSTINFILKRLPWNKRLEVVTNMGVDDAPPLSSRPPSPLNNPAFSAPYGTCAHGYPTCEHGQCVHDCDACNAAWNLDVGDERYVDPGDAPTPQQPDEPEERSLHVSSRSTVEVARINELAWFESLSISTLICDDCGFEAMLTHKREQEPAFCPHCGSAK